MSRPSLKLTAVQQAISSKSPAVYRDDALTDWRFERPEENLIENVHLDDFESDLGQGQGGELNPDSKHSANRPKFCALHSSSALAVNSFAPLKRTGYVGNWPEFGFTGKGLLRFEAKLPTGIHRSIPNLDALIEVADRVIGVEAKFTEYLSAKDPKIAEAFVEDKLHVEPCWWEALEYFRAAKSDAKQYLDVAQLIKHYLGLRRYAHEQGIATSKVGLLYVFWEPLNGDDFATVHQHREEIAAFSKRVVDSEITFAAMTFQELWLRWSRDPKLAPHAARLMQRYNVVV